MFGVVLMVGLLLRVVPGDPVDVMLGESAKPAERTALRDKLGLNKPLHEQLGQYFSGLIQGDLGESLHRQQPVTSLLAERLGPTARLAIAALFISMLIGVPAGLWAAVNHGGLWDRVVMGVAVLGQAVPNFWLGPSLVLLFSLYFGWTPVSGDSGVLSLVLPAVTLGTALAAVLARMTRSSVLEVIGEDFVRTARAKGQSATIVLWQHVLPNAALPIITVIGLQLGALLAGAVITEVVFDWPGIGSLLIDAIQGRDYPVVQACVLLIAGIYVLVNLGTDLLYRRLDPRLQS